MSRSDTSKAKSASAPPLRDAPSEGRRWHDMGGAPAGAPTGGIDPAEHDYALWEKRVDALVMALTAKGLFSVDGLRRALEDMGPDAFECMSYYERWVAAAAQNVVETGAVTSQELAERMAAVAARGASYGEASAAPSGSAQDSSDGDGAA